MALTSASIASTTPWSVRTGRRTRSARRTANPDRGAGELLGDELVRLTTAHQISGR
jgi:hypothetical protein